MTEHVHAVQPEPDMVQLLTPEGQRVEHPDYPLEITDDEIAALYRDLVLVRRIDTEAIALQRQGELGLWASPARPGGRADRRRPRAAHAGHGLPDLPRARRRLVPRRRPADAARAVPRHQPRRLGPARAQLQPVHDRHRRADPARDRLRDGRRARRRRRHRRSRPRHRRARLLRRRRVEPGRRQRGVRLGRRRATCRSSSSARTTSGRSASRSTTQSRVPLYQRASGFGFPGVRVDGNDVLACLAVTRKALDDARNAQGPTLIEAFTYRMNPHTTNDDPRRYRLGSEAETWKLQGPDRAGARLPHPRGRVSAPSSSTTSRPRPRSSPSTSAPAAGRCPNPTPESAFDHVHVDHARRAARAARRVRRVRRSRRCTRMTRTPTPDRRWPRRSTTACARPWRTTPRS